MYQVKRIGCYVLLKRTGPITTPMPRVGAGFFKMVGYSLPMFSGFLRAGNVLWSLYPAPRDHT